MGRLKPPEAERRRRPDNLAHVEVEIHGHDPAGRAESSLAASASLLQSLDGLRSAAEQLALSEWREQYLDQPEYPGLFLQALEFHDSGTTRLLFDFGDLDLLILDLHPDGRRTVTIEP